MDGNAPESGLNENHVRHVVATLRYIDGLLSKAEQIVVSADTRSPFQEYANDMTPTQRRVTHNHIVRIRDSVSRALHDLGIPRPAPVSGALWATQNALAFAGIALADVEPSRMRGYGKLSEGAARRIDGIVAELRAAIDNLSGYLAQEAGADLRARPPKLE